VYGMGRTNKPTNGRIHPSSSGTAPATPKQGENGYFLTEQSLKPVSIEGITVEGILQQMQLAYQTTQPVGTKDPVGVRRWRKLFITKPDKFLSILADQEKRFEASQKETKAHAAEFERRGLAETQLKSELSAALKRIDELEAVVPSGDDEYADPAVERLEELFEKLAKER
jgi:hypothetical protein